MIWGGRGGITTTHRANTRQAPSVRTQYAKPAQYIVVYMYAINTLYPHLTVILNLISELIGQV